MPLKKNMEKTTSDRPRDFITQLRRNTEKDSPAWHTLHSRRENWVTICIRLPPLFQETDFRSSQVMFLLSDFDNSTRGFKLRFGVCSSFLADRLKHLATDGFSHILRLFEAEAG